MPFGSDLGLVNVLRAYPTMQRAPWLLMLLETIADFSKVTSRSQLAEAVALRSRDIFGSRIRAVIMPIAGDCLTLLSSPVNEDVPDIFGGHSQVTTPYVAGQVFEITNMERYVALRPAGQPWIDAGIRYIVSVAFSPRSLVTGYVTFLHFAQSEYSDDELTLMQLLAALVGFELDRIDLLAA
jgi:hypothetical protein